MSNVYDIRRVISCRLCIGNEKFKGCVHIICNTTCTYLKLFKLPFTFSIHFILMDVRGECLEISICKQN